jgi:glutamate racemase
MIGIFDSGVGGFSVLKKLREREPHVDVLYYADIQNVPYGNKSQEELLKLATADIEVLLKHGARQIVSACNSVSQSVAQLARERFRKDFDFIEMSMPTISSFRGLKSSILVVGTKATIESELYQRGLSALGIHADGLAIPELAGAIERGDGTGQIEEILRKAFSGIAIDQYQMVLLGCTHYPLVIDSFKKVLPPEIILFDPAEPIATEVAKRFHIDGNGTTRFILSADSPVFRQYVTSMIFRDAPIEILSV